MIAFYLPLLKHSRLLVLYLIFGSLTGEILGSKSMVLNSGLVGQPLLFLCPGEKCLVIGGGTLEKFGIVCDGHLPSVKCDHPACKLEADGSLAAGDGFTENPNYLGCQGICKRWFHAFCLGFDYQKYIALAQRDYWQCNRFDCKKKK